MELEKYVDDTCKIKYQKQTYCKINVINGGLRDQNDYKQYKRRPSMPT